MSSMTFVVPVGSSDVYEKCFLSSPLFERRSDFQVLAQTGFATSGLAFNDAIEKATNDVIVFAHQDVMFPAMWAEQFLLKLAELESRGVLPGVVGCAGISSAGEGAGHIYRHDREMFLQCPLPARVETLDEMLIAFRKSSGLRFDPALPSFFGYAVDVCLQASSVGLQNFAMDVPCFHQAKNRKKMAKEFDSAWVYLLDKWRDVLPVRTLSGTLERGVSYWRERLKRSVFSAIGYSPTPWWANLPQINPEEVLFANAVSADREKK